MTHREQHTHISVITPNWNYKRILESLENGGLIYFEPGTYDLTDIPSSTELLNDLVIIGSHRNLVTLQVGVSPGEDAPGIGTDCFVFHGENFYMSGMKITGDRVGFSMQGLADRVEKFEIENCWFQDTSAGIKLDTVTATSGTELGIVRFNNNICRNVNSGVALRLGGGSDDVAYDIPVDYFEAIGNDLETVDKYGIVCNYDDIEAGYTYAKPTSYLLVARNRIKDVEGRGSSTVTGFGINVSATPQVSVIGNHLEDINKGVRNNIEPIYTKAPRVICSENVIVNCDGDQGCIALKGGTSGESVLVSNNLIIANHASGALNGIWVQNENCFIVGNDLRGTFSNSAIRTQSSAPYQNLRIENNEIYCDAGGGSHGIRIDTTVNRLAIKGNRIRRETEASGTWRCILITLGDGEAVADPVIADNILIAEGGSGEEVIGIELAPHASGAITDPQILNNRALDLTTFINLITANCTGTVMIQGNSEVGVTTDVNDDVTNTIDEQFNSWD